LQQLDGIWSQFWLQLWFIGIGLSLNRTVFVTYEPITVEDAPPYPIPGGNKMLKPLSLRILLSTLLILLFCSIPVMADDCPDLIEAECAGGTAWFGLRHDGANVGQGQTITLPCDSEVLSIEFMFQVTGNPNGGIPSLVAGDEIHVALIDGEGNNLTTATTAVPADVFDDWLVFNFPEGMVVPAGQYQFSAYTTVERNCGFHFAYGEGSDCYDGGNRVASLNGIEGPWFDYGLNDTPFRLHLDNGTVDTEMHPWGSVKGLYR
jgi:hypothetical protein